MILFNPIALDEVIRIVSGKRIGGTSKYEPTDVVYCLGEPQSFSEHFVEKKDQRSVCFLIQESFFEEVKKTKASVVVVDQKIVDKNLEVLSNHFQHCIVSPDAYLGLARLTEKISKNLEFSEWSFDSSDLVSDRSGVSSDARVASSVFIGAKTTIGARSVLLPGVIIAPGVTIGEDCVIYPGAVIYPRTQIGNRVRVHANVVLGSDGFGYARGPRGSEKIWHLGRCIIGDDVEIGAGTTIDRGTIRDTIIEAGAKIDNLVQIGHNGHVKSHAILCAQTGLAGNVTVGRGAILAGKVGVADKLNIGDGAIIGPMTGLSKDVTNGAVMMGSHPAKNRREWWKQLAWIDRLPDLYERLKKLEQKNKGE